MGLAVATAVGLAAVITGPWVAGIGLSEAAAGATLGGGMGDEPCAAHDPIVHASRVAAA
eukprot:gene47518-60678_t